MSTSSLSTLKSRSNRSRGSAKRWRLPTFSVNSICGCTSFLCGSSKASQTTRTFTKADSKVECGQPPHEDPAIEIETIPDQSNEDIESAESKKEPFSQEEPLEDNNQQDNEEDEDPKLKLQQFLTFLKSSNWPSTKEQENGDETNLQVILQKYMRENDRSGVIRRFLENCGWTDTKLHYRKSLSLLNKVERKIFELNTLNVIHKAPKLYVYEVTLNKTNGFGMVLGWNFDNKIIIAEFTQGKNGGPGCVQACGFVKLAHDELIAINGVQLETLPFDRVSVLLQESPEMITLRFKRVNFRTSITCA